MIGIYHISYKEQAYYLNMKKFLILAASALLAAMTFTSCEKEDNGNAPVLPSVETIKIKMPEKAVTKADVDPAFNYNAYIEQMLENWNKIYETIINIPVHGFELASNVTPVKDGKTWTWSVIVTEGLSSYEVSINGTVIRKDHVDWEIKVSGASFWNKWNKTDYAWITGTSALDGSEGSWRVMAGPSTDVVLVSIDWLAKDCQVQSVKVSYELDQLFGGILATFNGSYVEYSNAASSDEYTDTIVAHYNQKGLGFIDAIVEWNDQTGEFRIKSEADFGDLEWHC